MNAKDELQRLCVEGGSYARIKYLRNKIKRATIAELRKLLRERGVRFNEFTFMTQWAGALGEDVEAYPTDTFPDMLLVKHAYLTPEQAIAATLGRRTCHNVSKVMDEHGQARFVCSECSAWIDLRMLWNPEYRNGESPWVRDCKLNFCPKCGARVVEVVTV